MLIHSNLPEIEDAYSYVGFVGGNMDMPFRATDEHNMGYKTWGDYLVDEFCNGFQFTCPACQASLFIWLDCRRGDKDRYCVCCGHRNRLAVSQALRLGQIVGDGPNG